MAEPRKTEPGNKVEPASAKEGLSANTKHPTTPPLVTHPNWAKHYKNA